MRIVTIALAAMLAASGMAAGESTDAEACRDITDDGERLSCYDAAFKLKETPGEAANAESDVKTETFEALQRRMIENDWRLYRETSKRDDSTNVFLWRPAKKPFTNKFGREGNVTFMIACRENTTSLWFNFNGEFMSDLNHGTVVYRIDDSPAARRKFSESNDHSALGLWSGGQSIPLLKGMIGGQRLIIWATPHSGNEIEAEFDISLLADGLKPLREACNW